MTSREPRLKMTFRLPPGLATALRQLPNQTAFVESALREALGRSCPLCHGTGEVAEARLNISDLKRLPAGRLDRGTAAQLKAIIRLGRELLATQLELKASSAGAGLGFRLAREDEVLLSGRIPRGSGAVSITH